MPVSSNLSFKVDDIVHPDERAVAEKMFLCSICLCLPHGAIVTPCQHMFCGECVGQLLACPLCKHDFGGSGPHAFPALKEANPIMYRNLNDIKVICPYADEPAAADDRPPVAGGAVGGGAAASSSAGPAKRRRMEIDEELGSGAAAGDESDPGNCPWQGSYGDLLSKHVAECPNWAVSCPRECGKTMPRRALKQHETVCTKLLTMCKICGEAMRPEELEAHRAANVERHAALLEVKCGELEQENAEIQRQNADLRRGQSSLLNSVAWCFDLVDIPLLETPRPRSLVSKSFYLSGVGPLVIAVVRKQESIFFALLHVGHCKEHLGGGLPPRHLEGGLPCEEEWGGTLRATLSDPLTGHQYETGTEIPVKIGPEKAQKRVPMFLKSRFPKFEQKSLKIQIQDFSVGPVIGNDGIKRLLRTPVM